MHMFFQVEMFGSKGFPGKRKGYLGKTSIKNHLAWINYILKKYILLTVALDYTV